MSVPYYFKKIMHATTNVCLMSNVWHSELIDVQI